MALLSRSKKTFSPPARKENLTLSTCSPGGMRPERVAPGESERPGISLLLKTSRGILDDTSASPHNSQFSIEGWLMKVQRGHGKPVRLLALGAEMDNPSFSLAGTVPGLSI